MHKDFDRWNEKKKKVNQREKVIYCHAREIWWGILGANIGTETDGKNKNFERPVLILRVYNKRSIVILPITTKIKNDKYHYKISVDNKIMYVKLTQVRVIDTKRLLRKVNTITKVTFKDLIEKWKKHF